MKQHNTFKLIVLVISAIAYSGCWHTNSSEQNKGKLGNDTLLSKIITFPDNLYLLNDTFHLSVGDFICKSKRKGFFVSSVDGTCPACITNQLNMMDSLFFPLAYKNNVKMIFVLNVPKNDSLYFMRNIYPHVKTRGTLVLDNGYHFEKQNKMFTPDENLRTFLLDKNNRIVMYGNPLFYSNLLSEYENKLKALH